MFHRLHLFALLGALTFGTVGQAQAEQIAQAAGPTEIPRGSILVLDVGGPQRWIVMPSNGPEFHVYVATKSGDEVTVAVHRLPIGGDPDPDDPDPPPEQTLADAVDAWADAVNDPDSRAKLAAVYQFTIAAIDAGTIKTPVALKAFQAQADRLILGDNDKWVQFLTNVKARLDKLPNDIAAYRAAWAEIASGLGRGTQAVALDPVIIEHLLRTHAATWRP